MFVTQENSGLHSAFPIETSLFKCLVLKIANDSTDQEKK